MQNELKQYLKRAKWIKRVYLNIAWFFNYVDSIMYFCIVLLVLAIIWAIIKKVIGK